MRSSVLEMHQVCHTFYQGNTRLDILQDVSFTLKAGEIVALVGPSGSGKTTLLQIAGLLCRPARGTVKILQEPVHTLKEAKQTELRLKKLGFVYQFHHLLPEFSALENVMMPLLIRGDSSIKAQETGKTILKQVGLDHRLHHRPAQLSGGEQQRVAIARALIHTPSLLLGDEPTGNLDYQTAFRVFEHFIHLLRSQNSTALIATHDRSLAEKMDRILYIKDGQIQST